METYLLPLFTTVLGGFLAIAGVVVTHFFIEKRNKRKLLIEKLEEAYLIVNSLGDWIGNQQSMILGYKPEKIIEDPLSRVLLVLQVYVKDSEDIIELIKKSHSDILSFIFQPIREINDKESLSEFVVKRDILMKHKEDALLRIRNKISTLI